MKKALIISIASLFLIFGATGCGNDDSKENNNDNSTTGNKDSKNTLTCTFTETDDEGYSTEDKMELTYKDNKITNIVYTNIEKADADMIETSYSFSSLIVPSFNTINGMKAECTKDNDTTLKSVVSIDYSKYKVDDFKEVMGDLMGDEDSFYLATDLTLDNFKEKYLKEYTCE